VIFIFIFINYNYCFVECFNLAWTIIRSRCNNILWNTLQYGTMNCLKMAV